MKKLFTCLFFCFPFFVLAQKNYKKGTVLKNNGEVLNGLINYQERDNSPKYVEFKFTQQDNHSLKFYPDSVRSFEITDLDKFISYKGKITLNKTALNNLFSFIDTTHTNAVLFLRLVSKGSKINLYTQEDDIKTRYFIEESNSEKIEELEFYNYLDQNHEIQVKPYIRQLLLVAEKHQKASEVAAIVNGYPYNLTTLQKAVDLINDTKKIKKRETLVRFFVGAALNNYNTKFGGTNRLTAYQSSANYFPRISAGLDILGISGMRKATFRMELSYSANKPQFRQERLGYFDSLPLTETYSYTQNIISFTPQVIYNLYNSSKLKFFIGAGLGANFSSYSDDKYTYNRTLQYPEPLQIKYEYKTFWVNFPVQTGFVFNKRLDVFASYAFPTAYTDYVSFSVSSSIFGAGLHYYLNKN